MIDKELHKIKQQAKQLDSRDLLIRKTINHIDKNGDVLEFGVCTGRSLKIISECLPENTIYGFDSFTGLPEAWPGRESDHKKGKYSVGGKKPEIENKNIQYVTGYFDKSLPEFFKTYNKSISFIHIDCDIYSSTKIILDHIKGYIRPGLIILFDELIGYDGFELNEIKAWMELVAKEKIEYEYLYSHKYEVSLVIK